jgi:hypothetical protein
VLSTGLFIHAVIKGNTAALIAPILTFN